MAWYDPTSWGKKEWATAGGALLGGPVGALGGYMLGGASESADEAQAKLRAVGPPPPAPGVTPDIASYMEKLRGMANQESGAGWETSPYYKALMAQQQEQLAQRGYAIGGQHARQGATYYGQGAPGAREGPSYGAALKGSTEQQLALQQGTQQAAGQAYQFQVQAQREEFDRVLKAAGFTQGIQDSRFDQEMRVYLAKMGYTQAQIDAEMDEWRMYFGLAGGALNLGATLVGAGGGGGAGGAGAAPAGGGGMSFGP